jgi:UDP-glucose:(heptosyl)LPS alpha-1,3-glucosyltransferase
MKIGVIRQRYTAIGGAERYLDGLIRELVARGHDVHVFSNSWQSGASGFTFHHVPMLRGSSFLKALTFAMNSRRIVKRVGCDRVFSMERTLQQDVYRAGDGCHREWLRQRARFNSGLRQLSIAINPFHITMLLLERRMFTPAATARIIANSHRGKREIVDHYGYPADRIHVIHNGVDCDRFQPPGWVAVGGGAPTLPEEVTLLFVGTGFERKGLPFCIRALPLLPPNVRLKIVGKGDILRYRRLASSVGVERRVHFLGKDQDMPAIYQQADLLVHPAIYEPFANVCLEAFASGLPVVTSRINGISEIIEPGKNGAVLEVPEDVAGLAEAIQPFLNPKFRAMAAIEARQTAERHALAPHITETLRVITM